MKNRSYLFALLLPVFLTTADFCSQLQLPQARGNVTEAKGIKSTQVSSLTLDLSISPTTIYENSDFVLMATVRNPGTEVASNVKIKAERESGEFKLDEKEISLGSLDPPIRERILPAYQSWDVHAGQRSGKITVKLKYDYKTRAGGDIAVYVSERIKKDQKLMTEAQTSAGILSFEGSKAPVKVFLIDNGAYFYSESNKEIYPKQIIFSIQDAGNGIVTDMRIKATIKIGDKYCKNNEAIDLRFAGSTDIICDLPLPTPAGYKTTIPFNVEISYTYETSASLDIPVAKLY
jgi:hypothetical protein